jgi:hypothetical protein
MGLNFTGEVRNGLCPRYHFLPCAAHESPRTTKLYDRTQDEITAPPTRRLRPRVRLNARKKAWGADLSWRCLYLLSFGSRALSSFPFAAAIF